MIDLFRRHESLIILTCLFCIFLVLSLLSEGLYGGEDNITNFYLARYAFNYPYLFIDPSGKPLYTILSSPFTLFGFHGIKFFNILIGVITAFIAYSIARRINIRPAVMVIFFLCFMPVYTIMLLTALPEILAGFVLIFSILLFLDKKYTFSAIVISFLIFACPQGIILLPLFLVAFLWQNQARAIPFLTSGFILFSILGSFYYSDILWVIHRILFPLFMQHDHSSNLALWYFVGHLKEMMGLPILLMFVLGSYIILRQLLSGQKVLSEKVSLPAVLLVVPLLLFLSFLIFLSWEGLGESISDTRTFVVLLPVAAILALKGYESLEITLSGFFPPQDNFSIKLTSFRVLMIVILVYTAFTVNNIPVGLSPQEETLKEIAAWLETSEFSKRKIYTNNASLLQFIDAKPFDSVSGSGFILNTGEDLKKIQSDAIVIWGGLNSNYESGISEVSSLDATNLKPVNYFMAQKDHSTSGDKFNEHWVMVPATSAVYAYNRSIKDSLLSLHESSPPLKQLLSLGFEDKSNHSDTVNFSETIHHTGKFSFEIDSNCAFGPGFSNYFRIIPDALIHQKIRATVYLYILSPLNGTNTSLVISYENNGKSYFYKALNLTQEKLILNSWNKIVLSAPLPGFKSQDDILKVYIWNPNKEVFFMDDLSVDIIRN